MVFNVDSEGKLRCTGNCFGIMRPQKHDRFTYLECDRCGHQEFTTGVDNIMLYDVQLCLCEAGKVLTAEDIWR